MRGRAVARRGLEHILGALDREHGALFVPQFTRAAKNEQSGQED